MKTCANREIIYEFIKENPNATYRDIAEYVSLTLATVTHHIQKLMIDKRIKINNKWAILPVKNKP